MRCAKRLRFPDPLEKLFRDDYYENSIFICRAALAAALLLWMAFGVLDIHVMPHSVQTVWVIRYGLVSPLLLGIILVSFVPGFPKFMQPVVGAGVAGAGLGLVAITAVAQPNELGYLFYYAGFILVPMIAYSFLHLRFWHATAANLSIVAAYLASALFYQKILAAPQGIVIFVNNCFFIFSANIAGMATCYYLELSARRYFLANYFLDQERVGERRKRERTEAMLQVLGQAIGGIVHDLGNPLTAVESGAETLALFIEDGDTDKETLKEFTEIITDGAQMLNYLRLSLLEQSRVLEGKPIPVKLQPTSIRHILVAGARYQKPKFAAGRQISLADDDTEVCVDEMKMVTVFMNLIGNALKYSEGEIRITWQTEKEQLLIAILDRGVAGRGISQAQAEKLFVAFGRLDTHAEVEGTGLGLLSVRKIVEVHGGEVFIQGYADGTPNTPLFTTAQDTYPTLLCEDFRTAFIVACPFETDCRHPLFKAADTVNSGAGAGG